MDYPSLLAAQLSARPHPPGSDPDAEARYWRTQRDMPRPGIRLLVSIATTAGLVLMLIGISQV